MFTFVLGAAILIQQSHQLQEVVQNVISTQYTVVRAAEVNNRSRNAFASCDGNCCMQR